MEYGEVKRQSDYFQYGYQDAIAERAFFPTNGNSTRVGKESYVYAEYERGYSEGKKKTGG